MKYLSQGQESAKKIELLVSLTKIDSYTLIQALNDHLVNNFTIGHSCLINGCSQPNLSVALANLNRIASVMEKLHELKVYDLTHINKKGKTHA